MPGYDPQRNRRRPTAAETGEAPVDSLLGETTTAAPVVSPAVTPPPPTPDPDPRLVTATAMALALGVLTALVVLRRLWRRRRD
jgi:uncharacterized protein involved in exopolysaccharide biosynthesis